MKAYLLTVVWAAVAGTLAELIGGDDAGSGAKLLRLITGLMILSVVAAPIHSLLQMGPESLLDRLGEIYENARTASAEAGEMYTRQTMEYIRQTGEAGASSAVKKLLTERFDLPEECCRVEIDLTEWDGEFTLSSVGVILSGRGLWANPYAIETYLEEILCCPVRAAVE